MYVWYLSNVFNVILTNMTETGTAFLLRIQRERKRQLIEINLDYRVSLGTVVVAKLAQQATSFVPY